MIKLTIIGAGSAVFTRRIVTDLLAIEQFKNMEIALQDIDPVRLKAVSYTHLTLPTKRIV